MSWVEITTNLPCTNYCAYCPQNKLAKSYGGDKTLSVERFKRCLENIPNDVDIHFSGFSEPFLNQDTLEMMELAAKHHSISIYTTLIGLKDYDRFIRIPRRLLRVHDIGQHIEKLPPNSEYSPVKNIVPRAGNLRPTERREATVCSRGFNPVMLPDGTAVMCCQDYGLTSVVGDLKKDNWRDLKRGMTELCNYCEYAV